MKIIITGASGYIGNHLVNLALSRGYEVVAAVRSAPATECGIAWLPFDFSSINAPELPSGTKAIIHLAANTSNSLSENDENEILAAQSLIQAAQRSNIKFLFVSSQTAALNSPTAYGRKKWIIERKVLEAGGWVARPGQVYGGEERGLFGILVGIVRRFPLLPAFLPTPKVQPIHVDDLAEGLLRIVECNDLPSGVICLASSEPVPFCRFLLMIAKHRVRSRRWIFPVPIVFIKLLAKILGLRLKMRIGIDRLTSLFELPVMDTADDLKRLGISLRSLSNGMHRSGSSRNRSLLREGRALLTYILKRNPDSGALRRYVRSIKLIRGGSPINLPEFLIEFPAFIALFDGARCLSGQQKIEFLWRLDAATFIAEATPRGASRFLGIGRKSGLLISLWGICSAVFREVCWRLLRIAGHPILRQWAGHIGVIRES